MIEINKIYNESNCDTMSRMEDDFIDLTVTSPPYDNLRDYDGYEWDFERVAQELYRITKPGGVVVWIVGDATINGSETLTSAKQKIYFREVCGFNIHDTMLYAKKNAPNLGANNRRYNQSFEYTFILTKHNLTTFNPIKQRCITAGTKKNRATERKGLLDKTVKPRDIITVTADEKIKDNIFFYGVGQEPYAEHPAIFPEALAKDHIISWSNERELVYDPFMGSGTTAITAIKSNRNYVGSEISQKYCEIAERRIKPYKQQPDMFYEVSKNAF